MLTTLIDLFSTASAIGLVASLAALGVAVLPWTRPEAERTGDAFREAVRLPGQLAFASGTPIPRAQVARR